MKRARRKEPLIRPGSMASNAIEYGLMLFGAFIIALGLNLFLIPNQIASGGVSGISVILHEKFGFEPAVSQWAMNVPLFVAGWLLLGGKFGIRTALGSFVLPLFVLLTRDVQPPTTNLLLASVYGGICVGIGLGLVFRGRGSTGGLDLAAQIVHKYTGLSLGVAVACLDGMVILSAGIVLSPEKALYALIGLFVTSRTIDLVQQGFGFAKVAFIISGKTEEVERAVLHDLDRGLTRLQGYGGFTGMEKMVLMVVVGRGEVSKLKVLVKAVDPDAFIIISDTTEVLGQGFKID